MKRQLIALTFLLLVVFMGGCCRALPFCIPFFNSRGHFCNPSFIPRGHWHRHLPNGPWDRACHGLVDNEQMTRIVLSYGRELKHKYKLKLHDSRMMYNDKIYKLRLDFTTQQIVELCEARFLLVDIVEGYLSRINQNMILRGEIINRPFTPMNLEIHVTFTSFYVKYVDPMYIQAIIMEGGTSFFYNAEVNERTSDYWHKRIEPYSKTLEIVNIERQLGPDIDEKDQFNVNEKIGKFFTDSIAL